MADSSLCQEIFEIQEKAQPHMDMREEHHEKLFDVYRQIDAAIGQCNTGGEEADQKAAGLIEAQNVVMRTSAALPAYCLRDLLYKLAMWRWDASDLEQPSESMNRADAIVYSVFMDLVKMLGEDDVLKDFDKTNWR